MSAGARASETPTPIPLSSATPGPTLQAQVFRQRQFQDSAEQRVADVKSDALGRLVVLDDLAGTVRLLDREGRSQGVFGRRGGGPEEFGTGLSTIVAAGSRIYVPDVSMRRIAVIDAQTLELLETVPLASERDLPLQWVATAAGAVRVSLLSVSDRGQIAVGALRDGRVEVLTTYTRQDVSSAGQFGPAPPLLAGGRANEFLLADPATGEIVRYDDVGTVAAVYQWTEQPVPITDAARARASATANSETRQRRRAQLLIERSPAGVQDRVSQKLSARVSGLSDAKYYPRFAGVRVDTKDRLWIARPFTVETANAGAYRVSWNDLKSLAASWEVFGRDGVHEMSVHVPFGFVLTDIRLPLLFGYQVMEDETRRVTVLSLPVPGESRAHAGGDVM